MQICSSFFMYTQPFLCFYCFFLKKNVIKRSKMVFGKRVIEKKRKAKEKKKSERKRAKACLLSYKDEVIWVGCVGVGKKKEERCCYILLICCCCCGLVFYKGKKEKRFTGAKFMHQSSYPRHLCYNKQINKKRSWLVSIKILYVYFIV